MSLYKEKSKKVIAIKWDGTIAAIAEMVRKIPLIKYKLEVTVSKTAVIQTETLQVYMYSQRAPGEEFVTVPIGYYVVYGEDLIPINFSSIKIGLMSPEYLEAKYEPTT